MEKIIINKTMESPGLVIDSYSGYIEISGNSTLNNPTRFFKEVLRNIVSYFETPKPTTSINFRLNYVNTSSSKWIFYILKNIEARHHKKTTVQINWYYDYDDETILEAGETYRTLVKVPFNLIPEFD
jgi:hypothetical protein